MFTCGSARRRWSRPKETGEKKIWHCEEFTGDAKYSSTVVAEMHGKRQYVRPADQLGGIDAKTGRLLWIVQWPGRATRSTSRQAMESAPCSSKWTRAVR